MVIVTNASELPRIAHPGIRHLVAIRLQQLKAPLPPDEPAAASVEFIIVEPGDSATAVEQAAGFPILTSLFDDLPFDHPDFYPCHEILEEHSYEQYRIFEMVFIGNDDGAATAIFIPAEDGIDANLLAVCRSWATQASGPTVSTP